MAGWSNQDIAAKLMELADLLEQQDANPFRVNAYRRAARTVAGHGEPLAAIRRRGGTEALEGLPAVGHSIALAVDEMLRSGRWIQLERLRGALDPEQVFRSIPGVGPRIARRIHDQLHVDSLEALEIAVHVGRLEAVAGIGPRAGAEPLVEMLLDVDREYRERAAAGALKKIAPRRFNPQEKAWLPILHTQRGDWHFTTLFSNTARAHELRRTGDWVVLYFHTDSGPEGQRTVVTETYGPLEGRRVVRGREAECAGHYRRAAAVA
jgi:putative hydrolase